MSVTFNSSVAGVVSADNAAINVQFPSSQEITISDVNDSIKIGDGNGNYAGVSPEGDIGSLREQVVKAPDCVASFTWSDFGLATQRIAAIAFASSGVGHTATKSFSYTSTGGKYRLDSVSWSVT